MEERLKDILTKERLTPARFAELVGVQRSSVSHIISGRNKPSLDFLQKILSTFGHISPDWLISGIGPYKRTDTTLNRPGKPDSDQQTARWNGKIVFPLTKSSAKDEKAAEYGRNADSDHPQTGDNASEGFKDSSNGADATPARSQESSSIKPKGQKMIEKKKIVKTLLFYDDQTFEVFYPGN